MYIIKQFISISLLNGIVYINKDFLLLKHLSQLDEVVDNN